MKALLVINGHPDAESFSAALTEAYVAGLNEQGGVEVIQLNVRDLAFSPVLQHGYHQRTDHEPDLARLMGLFKKADHTVFIYPTWWGTLPAMLKGVIDRVFLPGHFFDYKPGAVFQTPLMKGKTARVITTMDMPLWYDRLKYGRPGYQLMKKLTLEFSGYKVTYSAFGGMKGKTEAQRSNMLEKAKKWGQVDAKRMASHPTNAEPAAIPVG